LAVEDLRDIKNYISKDSKYYAAIQIKKINRGQLSYYL
jgi:hypothetical protein